MFKKLKGKSILRSLFSVILLVAIGAVLICVEFSNMKSLMNGRVKFESLAPDEINGELIVDASIKENFGCFAEYYEENTDTHVTRTTDLYYVIWTGDDDDEDFRYMGIKVPVSDEDKMEAMAEATYYYESFEPIAYSGAINEMNDEEYKYFKEYFLDAGYTEQEIEDYTLPYYICVGALVGGGAITAYVIFGIGVLLVLIGLIRFLLACGGSGLKELKKELASTGISESEVEYEYENAKEFGKRVDLRIGRKLTFLVSGVKAHAIPNDKLVWVYQKTITHRTNGIKTGTTYEVVLATYEKKLFYISVNKADVAEEILRYIGGTMPWVVVGYSDELYNLFQRDYQNFLALCYNKGTQEQFYGGNDSI